MARHDHFKGQDAIMFMSSNASMRAHFHSATRETCIFHIWECLVIQWSAPSHVQYLYNLFDKNIVLFCTPFQSIKIGITNMILIFKEPVHLKMLLFDCSYHRLLYLYGLQPDLYLYV